MTRQTRNGGLLRKLRVPQFPRAFRIERCHQITNSSIEMHGVAAEAIIHQVLAMVVAVVEKDLFVSSGVRSCGPVRILLLMAFLTALAHPQYVFILEPYLLGYLTAQMSNEAMNVFEMKSKIESENISMANGARHVAMSGRVPVGVRLPDFMTPRARSPSRVAIVNTAGRKNQHKERDCSNRQADVGPPIPTLAFSGHGALTLRRGMSALPRFHQIVGRIVGDRHDRQRGIEASIGDVNAAVHDKQILHVVHAAILVDDGRLRIVSHAAGASLMLAPAQT